MIRIILYWGLYWGPPILEHYHITVEEFKVLVKALVGGSFAFCSTLSSEKGTLQYNQENR